MCELKVFHDYLPNFCSQIFGGCECSCTWAKQFNKKQMLKDFLFNEFKWNKFNIRDVANIYEILLYIIINKADEQYWNDQGHY